MIHFYSSFPERRFHWAFAKRGYVMVISDDNLSGERRWDIQDRGFELIHDSLFSTEQGYVFAQEEFGYEPMVFYPEPITFKEACAFVNQHHRHHIAPQGHILKVAIRNQIERVGVVLAGRPVARALDDGVTIEVTRCCVIPGYTNVATMLYSHASQVAKELGYQRIITYTLESESGVSMRAAGFREVHRTQGRSWNTASRPRTDKHPTVPKICWEKQLTVAVRRMK